MALLDAETLRSLFALPTPEPRLIPAGCGVVASMAAGILPHAASASRNRLRKAILRAQNHRGKIPGAGRRVQCGAEPDEASNTLTRRPATHHHASDSRARPHATVDWLRIIRARCRCLFMDCLSPCQIADMACSWTRLFTRTARGQSASVAAVTDCRNCGLCVDTDNPCSRLVHDESTVADCPCPCPRLWKMARLLARILRALQVLMKIRGKAYGRLSSFQAG